MTQNDRVLLNVRRFTQKPSECAIAATSSLANYYDPTVDYSEVRQMIKKRQKKDGLWTSQQARLLNDLGFTSITVVTAELEMIDFSWAKLNKEEQIKKLKKKAAYYGRQHDVYGKKWIMDMVDWLGNEECDNKLVIDWDFAKHIRRALDQGRPVGAAISWTTFFRFAKTSGPKDNIDDIKGQHTDHAIVLRGYDKNGVFVVDSHTKYYYGKRKKYKNGYYKIPWEQFLVNIPNGDLIIIR